MKRHIHMVLVIAPLALGACDEMNVNTEPEQSSDPLTQHLYLVDANGHVWDQAFRADLTPAELAAAMDFGTYDQDGGQLPAMTPLIDEEDLVDPADVPWVSEIVLEPIELDDDCASDDSAEVACVSGAARWVNGLQAFWGATKTGSLWTGNWSPRYTFNSVVALTGYLLSYAPGDYDLFGLNSAGQTVAQSTNGGQIVDRVVVYSASANNALASLQVHGYFGGGSFTLLSSYIRAF